MNAHRLLLTFGIGGLILFTQPSPATALHNPRQVESTQTPAHVASVSSSKSDVNEQASFAVSMRQAEAAERANEISSSALYWNKVGIVAVVCTLLASAGAAVAAGIAASAAMRANRHTEEISEHQLRPYVFIESVEFETTTRENPHFARKTFGELSKGLSGLILFQYKNTGSTPAKNVRIAAWAELVAPGQKIGFNNLPELADAAPLGPGEAINDRTDIVHAPDDMREVIALVRDYEHEIHLVGRVEYTDLWMKKRWTTFHFFAGGMAPWDGLMHLHQEGNDFG